MKDFLESSGVKTLPSKAEHVGFIPGRGAKIPCDSQPKIQNIKQKQCCSKFNKDFKNGPQPKKKKKKNTPCVRIIILNLHFRLEIENAELQTTVKKQVGKIEHLQTNLLSTRLVSQLLNFCHTEEEF